MADELEVKTEEKKGEFYGSLMRNNKKIRDDRAVAIYEDAEMAFKRNIEDMVLEMKKLKRDREAMLDLSPTSADSLVMASDFDAKLFVEKELEIGVKMRNLDIKMEIANIRFKHLFGYSVKIS